MLKKILPLLLISAITVCAQKQIPAISKAAMPAGNVIENNVSTDTLRILAIMVEFQEDNDATTVGNGKFSSIYKKEYGKSILDPLPHDKEYFLKHLEFAQNYFRKVSGGRQPVTVTVLPEVYTVSKTMRNYSPPIKSTDFKPMGDFAGEVWSLVDSANGSIDFTQYQMFIIFHAGVGRDVSLPGSLGNERDLPSVYLGLNSLRNIYGSSFNGFPVKNGTQTITNTAILPQTNNREYSSLTGSFLFEISINGLIVSTVASHLGLPDLFDTKTGLSAIGRFGLMDGQSIFAYSGSFPPEPSPWEKIRLGYASAIEYTGKEGLIKLVTALAASAADTVILKVRINQNEYFLIENRNRDAFKDGSKVTMWSDGQYITKFFPKDTAGYYSYAVDSLQGVVVDVDEFDWAVPGNGIVIWHIDEDVISRNIAANSINTDKNRRGVAVVEADGIRDIGEQFQTVFGDEVIGEGNYEDFWYSSNEAKLYKNIFDKTSRPSSASNLGANSLVSMSQFSDSANTMTFKLLLGDSLVKPVFSGTLKDIAGATTSSGLFAHSTGSDNNFYYIAHSHLAVYNQNFILVDTFLSFSSYQPVLFAFETQNQSYIAGADANNLNVLYNNNGALNIISKPLGASPVAAPVSEKTSGGDFVIYLPVQGGRVKVYTVTSADPGTVTLLREDATVSEVISYVSGSGVNGYAYNTVGTVSTEGVFRDNSGFEYRIPSGIRSVAASADNASSVVLALLGTDNKVSVYRDKNLTGRFDYYGDRVVLADLKEDGAPYLIYIKDNEIFVKNLTGGSADNFTFKLKNGEYFVQNPVAADFHGDNAPEILSVTNQGNIYAVDSRDGKLVEGFPLAVGSSETRPLNLFVKNSKIHLSATDNSTGYVTVWTLNEGAGKILWASQYSDAYNSSVIPAAKGTNKNNNFFPKEKAYNYPNPVYGNETYIRFYVSEDASVNIKIFDLSGDLAWEKSATARGGFDNEVVWDVSQVESGVYLANLEVESGGRKEFRVIKIAVVK